MNDEDIIRFIRSLDAKVSKEDAKAKFVEFGEVALYANKEGYLRMAVELLKCAFPEECFEADLNYLFTTDSDFGIEHLTVTEQELKWLVTRVF
ncbi:hypothetical protein [Pleionea sp. CnH1-48]|uniref:hypothetical protein n=1 Tax=Pleionea sp. CnH1-48 TaxID=2954494 RepID=UPI002096B3E2|nr:hypothetical protein [Pleionea sp. CnH1-48]MCO7223281.1 hypothetical protein [Pleionea sp. CnH1-48]